MKLKTTVVTVEEGNVDAVTALRARAARHLEKELERPLRGRSDGEPVDLWTAKLCLEIADLIQKTEPRKRGRR